MKKIISTVEVDGEGLEALLGEHVLIKGFNYFYSGILSGVNDTDIILTEPKVVFQTGEYNTPGFDDAQALPATEWRVRTAAIESYGSWPLS